MRNVLSFVVLWLGLTLQSTLFEIPPINLVYPDLVLVVLILIALARGPRVALILGVLIGFVQDAEYGSFIGLNAFAYGVIGYFAAATFAQFLHKNVAVTLLVTVICTFVHNWMAYGMTRLFGVTGYSWYAVLALTLEQMVVNGVVVLLSYPLLVRWFSAQSHSRYRSPDADRL